VLPHGRDRWVALAADATKRLIAAVRKYCGDADAGFVAKGGLRGEPRDEEGEAA
jgi:hypothetical protein